MKKITLILLSALLALSLCACVAAEEDPSNIDDYAAPNYTHKIETGTLTFKDGYAESAVISDYDGLATTHKVVIPDIIENRQVTGIGDEAFYQLSTITSVKIPDTVTFIGKNAFAGCSALESITIPASVTYIDEAAFANCSSLKSITFLGTELESIGEFAFWGCSALTTITLPEGLEVIDNAAFKGCEALTSIKTPSTLEKIGNLVFENCTALNADGAIVLSASITEIGEGAFNGIDKSCIKAPEGSYAADYVSKMADSDK